jgi:competence ComEA-like helix-hairpin-helix protein
VDKEQEEENARIAALLPDGEAKTILLARCVGCHGLARVSAGKKSLKSWTNTIKVMVVNGVTLEDKEVEPLAKLLAASFALPVNINTATAAELASVPGLEPSLAAAIVRYREKNGDFSNVQDLSRVEGVSQDLRREDFPPADSRRPAGNAGWKAINETPSAGLTGIRRRLIIVQSLAYAGAKA